MDIAWLHHVDFLYILRCNSWIVPGNLVKSKLCMFLFMKTLLTGNLTGRCISHALLVIQFYGFHMAQTPRVRNGNLRNELRLHFGLFKRVVLPYISVPCAE